MPTPPWGMAGALSIVLLTCVVGLLVVFQRLIGINRMRVGQ